MVMKVEKKQNKNIMTKQQLLEGKKFKYGWNDRSIYKLHTSVMGGGLDDLYSITEEILPGFTNSQFSIEKIGTRIVKGFTFVMDKRINVSMRLSDCTVVIENEDK